MPSLVLRVERKVPGQGNDEEEWVGENELKHPSRRGKLS